MDTQNKQWVCHPLSDSNSGQLDPEDLSSSKNLPNCDKPLDISINEQQVIVDIQNKNGLDQFFVQQIEDAICDNSRQIITHILDEVTRLTSIEKLLLYLKLPTDFNSVTDPLRQPLNPLGSRTEISQTIMWIRTHLEEDPELSLPKQEVYNEYTTHCANNKMKPLSTADFGKVMKQVYPSVRPRRLGTRGNSRYCYAGLRKRFKLEVPQLPEMGDRPQSTELMCTQNELTTAACTIICEWAEGMLGKTFQSVYMLASYLVQNVPQTVNNNSAAATLLASYTDGMHAKDAIPPEVLPYSNHISLKHKEAQLQLQRKLHQREMKRKLQQSPKTEQKPSSKCKKIKTQTPSRTVSLDSIEKSQSPKPQVHHQPQICDNTKSTTTTTTTTTNECTLPDFNNSFQHHKNNSEIDEPDASVGGNKPDEIPDEIDIKPNFAGKLPIPRLPIQKLQKPIAPVKNSVIQSPKKILRSNHLKYKAIQPKPTKKCDKKDELSTAGGGIPDVIPVDDLKNTDYLTRERLISVSNVDKDALDDYLHGGNNSQEQEEELMQYFKNNNNYDSQHQDEGKSDKLSQLRLLLEQNLMSAPPKKLNKDKFTTKRRVSFETTEKVPPSPNTRRKNFSFTPISPGPNSPSRTCSSTNASPFVSPRNTPVPRAKVHTNTTTFIAQKNKVKKPDSDIFEEKIFGEIIEEKHFVNPTDIIPKCNLAMSAPPSPMFKKNSNPNLLQKLLDSNSKVSYVVDYEKTIPPDPLSAEVTTLLSQNFNPVENYRSQSVPLHQMTSYKTLISPCMPNTQQNHFNFGFQTNSVPPTPNEFTEFDQFPELNTTGLNNENLTQILNILETTQEVPSEVPQAENVFNFEPNTTSALLNSELLPGDLDQKLIRSQSIDLDLEMRGMCSGGGDTKYSRSVPNTPLPYTKLKSEIIPPDMYGMNQDFLLNGQPVMNYDNKFTTRGVDTNFGARRNLNRLLEPNQYQEGDEYNNATVPRINRGTS